MPVILGGTGHIGSALVQTLLDRGELALGVTHDADEWADWEATRARWPRRRR